LELKPKVIFWFLVKVNWVMPCQLVTGRAFYSFDSSQPLNVNEKSWVLEHVSLPPHKYLKHKNINNQSKLSTILTKNLPLIPFT